MKQVSSFRRGYFLVQATNCLEMKQRQKNNHNKSVCFHEFEPCLVAAITIFGTCCLNEEDKWIENIMFLSKLTDSDNMQHEELRRK